MSLDIISSLLFVALACLLLGAISDKIWCEEGTKQCPPNRRRNKRLVAAMPVTNVVWEGGEGGGGAGPGDNKGQSCSLLQTDPSALGFAGLSLGGPGQGRLQHIYKPQLCDQSHSPTHSLAQSIPRQMLLMIRKGKV